MTLIPSEQQLRIDSAKAIIRESLQRLTDANELIYRIDSENVAAANESLCSAIRELKGCLNAL